MFESRQMLQNYTLNTGFPKEMFTIFDLLLRSTCFVQVSFGRMFDMFLNIC